ncbi:MAG: hypothetical protein Q6361_04185 [Candidatus Hermodarchaeota archaeon]|nr:hypothetical protein [Candidatus Hermodarchaeota archaeon]
MAGILSKVIGVCIMILGVILLVIFMLDDFTIIGIIDNLLPIGIIVFGAGMTGLKLPKLR